MLLQMLLLILNLRVGMVLKWLARLARDRYYDLIFTPLKLNKGQRSLHNNLDLRYRVTIFLFVPLSNHKSILSPYTPAHRVTDTQTDRQNCRYVR